MNTENDIKFGPEWLRNLTSKGNSPPSPPNSPAIKYSKPEYAYGREEMLALFNTATEYTAINEDCKSLFVSAKQFPIAFEAQAIEESDIWSCGNINSELALKAAGKHGLPNGERLGRGGLRGTGAIDRGRGRSRPFFRHDDDDGGYSRPRMNDRQLPPLERDNRWEDNRDRRFNNRSFSNRGNIEEVRKDGGASVDNWRKPDKERERETEEPIRRNYSGQRDKFIGGRTNWRKSEGREDDRYKPSLKPLNKKSWDEDQNRGFLPEWSMDEGQDDKTGSFDSSGAFRNNSSEDEDGMENEHLDSKSNSNVGSSKDENFEDSKVEIPLSPIKSLLPQHHPVTVPTPEKLPNISKPSKVESELSSHSTPPIPIPNSALTPSKSQSMSISPQISKMSTPKQSLKEEEVFAHMKSPKDNIIPKWGVKEEEPRQMISSNKYSMEKSNGLPLKHVNAYKWFYNDPQGKIQGPFSSEEMLEWYNVGYFDTYLLVRRGCDEAFAQIGELSKLWGVNNPFLPNAPLAPPLRAGTNIKPVPIMVASGPSTPVLPNKPLTQPEFNHHLVQQQQQQMLQHQFLYRQIYSKLKLQDEFNSLSTVQQQNVVMSHMLNQQQQQQSPHQHLQQSRPSATEIPNLIDPLTSLQLNSANPKEVNHLWNMPTNWPIAGGMPAPAPNQVHSPAKYQYWDSSELEKEKRLSEENELKKIEEQKKLLEEERRKHEEEQRRQEEERLRIEELRKQQEEEKRKLMEFKQKQEEEDRRRREELRLQEEQRKQEERRRLQEEKQREEKRRMDELRLQEERERVKREKEQKRLLEENKMKEEMRRREEELRRQKDIEYQVENERREREQQHMMEQKRKQQIDIEMARMHQQQMMLQQQAAFKQQQQQHQGPVWGVSQPSAPLSLAEIQKIEEEKDKEEKRLKAIRQNQQIQQQQATQKLTWAQRSVANAAPAKSLDEIQREESEKLELMKQNKLKAYPPVSKPVSSISMGAWNNGTSHITQSLNNSSNLSAWEYTAPMVKQPIQTSESSEFPPVNKTVKQLPTSSNKSKVNSQNKKERETVIKIKIQPEPSTDEFTKWCLAALKAFSPPVDIPTYVSFLKDIDSPYEVNDYVKSYLGDTKESREFAKNFLENRSKFRNQKKKKQEEEIMWGPAPAVNPTPKTSTVKNTESDPSGSNTSNNKGKKKKNKKMQKVDNSLLGFTVNQDNRINVLGESDQIAG